jgi:hypothetical protein
MIKKEFFLISLTIFVSVIVWMIADIYHAFYERKIAIPKLPSIKTYHLDDKILNILVEKQP